MGRNNKTGFTLIETIVAFAIIAIILVVALIGFNTISRVDLSAQGWNASDQAIENLIAQGGSGNDPDNQDKEVVLTIVTGGETFKITGDIRTYVDGGKSITVFAYVPRALPPG